MTHNLNQQSSAGYSLRSMLFPISFAVIASATAVHSQNIDRDLVQKLHPSELETVNQDDLNTSFEENPLETFLFAFDVGDELFEADFTLVDGGGANVGNGELFTRIPRADLDGEGEWANHTPMRATGPNGTSCVSCHFQPVADGAGGISSNVHRDPFHTGKISMMIQRNTPHLHGMGGIQRLAEEMTEELQTQRDEAITQLTSNSSLKTVTVDLESKGVSYGQITLSKQGRSRGSKSSKRSNSSKISTDYSGLEGLDEDLVVKPFQWKGNFTTVRAFNLDAMHNEVGIQPHELLPDGVDGDGDGYHTEISVGDMTALTLYLAAQPRPTTNVELGENGFADEVSQTEIGNISAGEAVFSSIGCATCHMPEMTIEVPIFSEPSTHSAFRDAVFPGGQDPASLGLIPDAPMTFDLTADIPDNEVTNDQGEVINHIGVFEKNSDGNAIVRLYGDLKRHDMGPGLAEAIDETGVGASVFMTENLWGVGVTAPYLHDGRATTLTEAILWHGGEATASQEAFKNLSEDDQNNLIAFLENLVIFLPEE
ncbi:MAG: di-heme oxidoredictase family protein [Akkermansiaceae bacterium]